MKGTTISPHQLFTQIQKDQIKKNGNGTLYPLSTCCFSHDVSLLRMGINRSYPDSLHGLLCILRRVPHPKQNLPVFGIVGDGDTVRLRIVTDGVDTEYFAFTDGVNRQLVR